VTAAAPRAADGPQPSVTFALQLLLALAFWSYAPLVEFLRRDLALGALQLALLPLVLDGAGLALAPLGGWWVDRANPATIAQVLLAGAVAGLVLAGALPTYPTVLLGLGLVGMTFVAVGPLTNRLLQTRVRRGSLGLAFSVKQSAVTVGMAMGALSLPAVAGAAGWQAGFLTAAAVTGAAGAVVLWNLRRLSPGSSHQAQSERPPVAFVAGLAEAVRSPAMRQLFAVGFAFQGLTFIYMTFTIPFLVDSHGLSLAQAGLVLVVIQLIALASRPTIGWLSDRFPTVDRTRHLIALAAVIGVLMLAAALPAPTWAHVMVLVLGGALALTWVGLYFARLAELWPNGGLGLATGIALVPIKLGGMLVPLLAGLAIDRFSYRAAFAGAGAVLALAAIIWAHSPRTTSGVT
jgi:predicted MFS family arabinose efflux permease